MDQQDELDRGLEKLNKRLTALEYAAAERQKQKREIRLHTNSLKIMENLLGKYAPKEGLCVDVGSYNVNGTYRALVEGRGLMYLGVDIAAGPNVDIVCGEYEFSHLNMNADLVISGQCLEHTRHPWKWIHDTRILLKDKAPLILIAPAMWPQHRYPVDCWRILPDGMQALMEWAGLEVLETGLSKIDASHADCWGVGRL